MAKRAADGVAPPSKRAAVLMAPLDIGPAMGEEDLSLKVLQVQNRMLSERLRERNFGREQLEARAQELQEKLHKQRKTLAAIPRHLLALRDNLAPLLSKDCTALSVMTSSAEGGQSDERLEEGFGAAVSVLRALVEEGKSIGEVARLAPTLESAAAVVLEDDNRALQTRCEETEAALADLRFDFEQSSSRVERLQRQLFRALEPVVHATPLPDEQAGPPQPTPSPAGPATTSATVSASTAGTAVEKGAGSEVSLELKEAEALAADRLKDIEVQSQQIMDLHQEVGRLRARGVTEEEVKASPTLMAVQAQLSIVQQENSQLLACVEELKALLVEARTQHFTQLEEIRMEEMKYEVEVRDEVGHLEALLASAKRDLELLRMEYERRLASNEQAAPMAQELRVTVESLQKTIQQLKSEVNRYKTRAHKAEARLQEEAAKPRAAVTCLDQPAETSGSHSSELLQLQTRCKQLQEEKASLEDQLKVLSDIKGRTYLHSEVKGQSEAPDEVEEEEREIEKLEREKATIIASERKARSQAEDLRRKLDEVKRDYEKRKEHLKEEAARRTKALAEDNKHLQKELAAKKQEAQALVGEMECTAQAFEDMQEQNLRLLQQLREKDDANFKVISERIKASSLQKLLTEEKELLQAQLLGLGQEKARLVEVIGRMEERERGHEATLQAMEKDMALRQLALDTMKKKALDSVQSMQQLQLKAEEEENQCQQLQASLASSVEERESTAQQLRRVQEEVGSLRRKLERYRSREWGSTGDEVLLEEIRTYKSKLNCPCCSTRKKDTVLTKCFHVFCSECIRSRYDSRLRKCPKCGAAFGANDFHKLYLS